MARQQDSTLWKLLNGSLPEWLWFLGGLALLTFALWGFTRLVAWMRDDEDHSATDQMMLTEISELHRHGDLSEEEYRNIKGRLLSRLDKTPDAPESADKDAKED